MSCPGKRSFQFVETHPLLRIAVVQSPIEFPGVRVQAPTSQSDEQGEQLFPFLGCPFHDFLFERSEFHEVHLPLGQILSHCELFPGSDHHGSWHPNMIPWRLTRSLSAFSSTRRRFPRLRSGQAGTGRDRQGQAASLSVLPRETPEGRQIATATKAGPSTRTTSVGVIENRKPRLPPLM